MKQAGNEAYKQHDFAKAVELYTRALELYPKNDEAKAIFQCNRAAANLQLKEYQAVVDDCTESLRLKPQYIKALNRRSQALENMGQERAALQDFKVILQQADATEAAKLAGNMAAERIMGKLAQQNLSAYLDAMDPDVLLPCDGIVAEFLNLLILPAESATVSELSNLVAATADDGVLYYRRALAKCHAGRYRTVAADAQKAVDLLRAADSDRLALVGALNVLGIFSHLSMQGDVCEQAFSEAMQMDESNARTFGRFALCLSEWHAQKQLTYMSEYFDRSLVLLSQAVRLASDDPEVLCIRARMILCLNLASQNRLGAQQPEFALETAYSSCKEAVDLGHPYVCFFASFLFPSTFLWFWSSEFFSFLSLTIDGTLHLSQAIILIGLSFFSYASGLFKIWERSGYMPHVLLGLCLQLSGQSGIVDVLEHSIKLFPDEPILKYQVLELQIHMSQHSPATVNKHFTELCDLANKHPAYPQVLSCLACCFCQFLVFSPYQ